MTHLEGNWINKDNWKEVTQPDFKAYMVFWFWLVCIYQQFGLWDAESCQTILQATLSLQKFHRFSLVLLFDNCDTRPDKWVEHLPLIYNPSPNVTVDEHLVALRGRCPFKLYKPRKPSKYGLKIWAMWCLNKLCLEHAGLYQETCRRCSLK